MGVNAFRRFYHFELSDCPSLVSINMKAKNFRGVKDFVLEGRCGECELWFIDLPNLVSLTIGRKAFQYCQKVVIKGTSFLSIIFLVIIIHSFLLSCRCSQISQARSGLPCIPRKSGGECRYNHLLHRWTCTRYVKLYHYSIITITVKWLAIR